MAYTPTLWAKGDKVTSEKLNKIEQGIVDKVDKETGKTLSTNDFTNAYKTKLEGIEANANKTKIDATLTSSGAAADAKATGNAIKDIENDLDGKVATIESDLDEKVENLKSLVGTPLKATTASAMTDTNKIYVYTGNESGYTNGDWYYHDGSAWVDGGTYNSVAVEVDKTLTVDGMPADSKTTGDEIGVLKSGLSDLKEDLNYLSGINIGELTTGKYINRNNGTEGDDSNSSCTGFIPVNSGLYVCLRNIYTAGVRGIALYDSNQTYKSSPSSQGGNTEKEFLIPDNVAYMRFTVYKNNLATAFYSNVDDVIYNLLTQKLNNNLGVSENGKHLVIDSLGNIATGEFFKGQVNSSNPINANAIKENGWYSGTVSGKAYFTNIPNNTSGVITLYTTIKVGGGSSQANQFVVDQQMSIWGRLLDTSTETALTDWVKLVDNSGAPAYQVSRWFGKTIKCFGDSRTWYDGHAYNDRTKEEWAGETCVGYQQTLAQLTGATIQSDGHSGATSPTICNYIRSANLTGVDAVLLEGGVNDYIVGAPSGKTMEEFIGAIDVIGATFDTSTIYGAWQSAVEYILTNYPQVKIYMTIPAIAWDDDNTSTVFPYSIAEIKGNIAELYNIPCIDLYKDGGINIINRDYYYADDVDITGWRLHFNDYGNALIGEELAGFINTY